MYALGAAQEDSQSVGDGEISAKEKEKIAAVAEMVIVNQVRLLATESTLHHVMDETFNLLLINCKDRFMTYSCAILLCRSAITPTLKSYVIEDKLTIDQLSYVGHLEYSDPGVDPPDEVTRALIVKYRLQ